MKMIWEISILRIFILCKNLIVSMTFGAPLMSFGESFQVPINPYGKAKKMAEDIIIDFSKTTDMAVMILR